MTWFQSPLVWSRKENYSISWELQMPIGVPVAAGILALLAFLALAYHCLKEAGRGPAGNPLFRAPWPSAAFPSVPLKALMAPGLLLSFGYEEEPSPMLQSGCGIHQALSTWMERLQCCLGCPWSSAGDLARPQTPCFLGSTRQRWRPAGRPVIHLFCVVGACYFPTHQLATKPFSDFARAEQALGRRQEKEEALGERVFILLSHESLATSSHATPGPPPSLFLWARTSVSQQ